MTWSSRADHFRTGHGRMWAQTSAALVPGSASAGLAKGLHRAASRGSLPRLAAEGTSRLSVAGRWKPQTEAEALPNFPGGKIDPAVREPSFVAVSPQCRACSGEELRKTIEQWSACESVARQVPKQSAFSLGNATSANQQGPSVAYYP
jgi:hypothetical protein